MNRNLIAAALIALSPAAALAADPVATKPAGRTMADHPAVAVQRLYGQQGYDYAAKFYPHPAWLYLFPESPDVMLAKREAERREAVTASAEAATRITASR